MNYDECIKSLTSQEKFRINLGLDRMKKIAELFGNPQDKIKIIHVAGTNGKGSTCAMLAKICEMNGLKTGLYTSPHLINYTERFKVNFSDMSKDDFGYYFEKVEKVATKNNIILTEFETLTVMGFLYFYDKKTDILLLETGMGGRLDATNIIKSPILTVITSISSDHNDRLGNSIEKIASEKAGILKKNVPVIISQNNPGFKVIEQKAREVGANLIKIKKDFVLKNAKENIFSNGIKDYKLALAGVHQGENLALVDRACEYLNLKADKALKNIVWNCRMEYIKGKNLLIDGTHNPDAARILKQNIEIYFQSKKRVFLFGMLNTKDYKAVIKNLLTDGDEIFVTDGFAHNALNKEILSEEINKQFKNIKVKTINLSDIQMFIDLQTSGIKICCGSFYLCAKLLEKFMS